MGQVNGMPRNLALTHLSPTHITFSVMIIRLSGLQKRMKDDFKIHCIALCKNEADVIGACLREAVQWADFIYVYDGGSTDGTWEVVRSLNHPRIIPWKQDGKVFKEGLQAEVFN